MSLWYLFEAQADTQFDYDPREFHGICWTSIDALPAKKIDPHLRRFCHKLQTLC